MNGGRITSEDKATVSTYIGVGIATLLVALAIYFFILTQEKTKEVSRFDPNRPVPSDAVLKKRLKPEQYHVVRENGTQMPFRNDFWDNTRPGLYVDIITGEPLFTSLDKIDAGLGQPTFSKAISNDLLVERLDTSHEMQRVELRTKRSDALLGHRFPDPKSPSGQNLAINSAALRFVPLELMKQEGYEGFLPLVEKK
jgi:peptide methionine sulfoxide reductase msrA/msrB